MFLLETVCKEEELWVVAEALDAIFDVFGEDHLNGIITEIRLIDRLRQLLPGLKAKVGSFLMATCKIVKTLSCQYSVGWLRVVIQAVQLHDESGQQMFSLINKASCHISIQCAILNSIAVVSLLLVSCSG